MNVLKIMNRIYGVLIFTLVVTSCNRKLNQHDLTESEYCANEINLFSIPDSMSSIDFDYNLSKDSIVEIIQNEFEEDICNEVVYFGLQFDYPIKVKFLKECFNHTVCFRIHSAVNISINPRGYLRLNSEIIPIDSLKSWIGSNYPSDEPYKHQEVSIKWSERVPTDSLKKVFSNIVDGYLLNYEVLAHKLYSKSICDLSNSQVDSLKIELPFNLKLNIGQKMHSVPLLIIEEVSDIDDVKSNHQTIIGDTYIFR